MKLNVPYEGDRTGRKCLICATKMVLDYKDNKSKKITSMSKSELNEVLKPNYTGTKLKRIIKLNKKLKKQGLIMKRKWGGGIQKVKNFLNEANPPIIVYNPAFYFEGLGGIRKTHHSCVATGWEKGKLKIHDPSYGRNIKIDEIDNFIRAWRHCEGLLMWLDVTLQTDLNQFEGEGNEK